MAKPNKAKLLRMVGQAGGKENFNRILPVPSKGTQPAKPETVAKWAKRIGA